MMYFSPPALAGECRICQSRSPTRDLAITNSQPSAAGQQPCLAPRARKGEEAATPGQPVAQARFWKFSLWRFTLENHRLPPTRRNHLA